MPEPLRHQASLVVFVAVILGIALWNAATLRRLSRYGQPRRRPFASILVPARDERDRIERCVRSLLVQDYVPYEVVVLDDHSSDGTGEVLARLAQEAPHLRALRGAPLPPGWLGKHWACHQLADAARGELLVFVDADTEHAPTTLASLVAAFETEEADLISGLVREEVVSWGERLLVPMLPWSILAFVPLPLAYRLRSPALAAGIGQFMCLRRAAYEALGGYAAVREQVVDDLALVRRAAALGLRWRLVDATELVGCRMYRTWREVWQGLGKSLFAAFGYHALGFIFVWSWLALAFTEPVVVLGLWTLGLPHGSWSPGLAGAAAVLSLALWTLIYARMRLPLFLVLLYPLTTWFWFAAALCSFWLAWTGRAVWKGRNVAPPRVHWL